jgi:hypothetical protein
LGQWHPGDVACPSKKSAIVISVEGLNGKALQEAGRGNTAANFVSDGNAAHDSSASVMEITKMMDDRPGVFEFRRKIDEANRIPQITENV